MFPATSTQLRADHLGRQAFIYVRQSTLLQVREHTASTARQYHLVQRAKDLGWPEEYITVIDQDQGRSGASAVGRDGFEGLLTEVGMGRAGAVFSLEASRLARSCSDWYRLLEICALTDTLVIDEDGIYDPNQYNDRLLLGFRGTLSEAELHWLHSRLLGGKEEKARQGQLRFRPPVGLVFDAAQRLVLDPDEEVQQAVRLVFERFDTTGSALAVVKHFAIQHLHFPTRHWGRRHGGELAWIALQHSRVLAILHNPAYAGAYVYGRTRTRIRLLPGETSRLKGRTRKVDPADWPIVLPDAHPGYISWEEFRRNQQRLDDNRADRDRERRGAVREGAALLQGIVLCGRCGRRMTVRYLDGGGRPQYECNQVHAHLAGKTCQSLRGDGVDAAVAQALLDAMTPAEVEISLATLEAIEAQARALDRQWQLRLERARYEADLARRHLLQVEPENRLVARSLEREWNERLAAVEHLEREYASLPGRKALPVSAEERQRILALTQDLPALWQADTTTAVERKQLLRLLIKEVTLTKEATTLRMDIRWQTHACSTLEIPRPRKPYEVCRTDSAIIDRVRQWAATQTDAQIAAALDAAGLQSGQGGPFTAAKVRWIRYAYHIASGCPQAPGACADGQRGDGRYSARAAAALLNVDVGTIADWCASGGLDCLQSAPHGPRWIRLTPETLTALRKPAKQHWQRNPDA